MSGIEILFSDASGMYIPQRFAEECVGVWENYDSEDIEILMSGPEHESYWDAWHEVLSTATFTDSKGDVWTLHQDGDLFAVCVECMTPEEYRNFFDEEPEYSFWEEYAERNLLCLYVLPAHWASALINGDESGLEDSDIKELNEWEERKHPGYCVDVSEAFFAIDNDANNMGGDVAIFLFTEY